MEKSFTVKEEVIEQEINASMIKLFAEYVPICICIGMISQVIKSLGITVNEKQN